MEQAPCPECEQQVGVTKAGLFYKHATGDGPCPGSGKAVAEDDGDDWLEDEPQPVLVGEPGPELIQPGANAVEAADNAPAGGRADTYTWLVRVSLPALYLDDAGWHQQNELMAVKQAEGAGCVVAGEARWDRRPDYSTPGVVVLSYLAPIKS